MSKDDSEHSLISKIRRFLREHWYIHPRLLRIAIMYELNCLTSIFVRPKVYPYGIMKTPQSLFFRYDLKEGEKNIMDLIKNLGIKGVGIDVGAWAGKYSLLMSKTAKNVVSIEPDKLNFKFLKENIKLNKINNIQAVNAALTVSDGVKRLQVSWATAGHSLKEGGPGYNVQCFSLSSILDEIKEQYIDLIKMDIEGEELKILRNIGNREFERIKKWIVEVHSTERKDIDDIHKIFDNQGYSIEWMKNTFGRAPVLYLFARRK